MGKRIIAVNAGPRIGWNTDTLITEASKGAEASGASVERSDWPWFFNPEDKYQRHGTVFPEEMKKAFSMGAALTGQGF